ncbi:MAG: hypothetical protein KJ921_16630, partial [Proteobacteria bacterium]|nr:hypothetical protein [Pseudomonadota bacterium]
MGIPDQYLPILQAIHFNKGVPISWLAAVCEMTGWDADFNEMNYDRVPNSVRRFGIAGIWASIPEITFPDDQVYSCQHWSTVPAGWVPAVYWVGTQLWQGA